MRYREGTEPAQQADKPSSGASLFPASLAIGFVLLLLRMQGKQKWRFA